MTWREQYLPGPIACHVIDTHLNPGVSSWMASYDVASNICQALEHGPPRPGGLLRDDFAFAGGKRGGDTTRAREPITLARRAPPRAPGADAALRADVLARAAVGQGLTLVHFSAQPEPFFSLKPTETTQCVLQKVLTSGRKVDKCKGLPIIHFSALPEPFLSHPHVSHKKC